MGRNRKLTRPNMVRPVKSGTARRSKLLSQRRRLVALGMPEDMVEKLKINELRQYLRHPKKTEKQFASSGE